MKQVFSLILKSLVLCVVSLQFLYGYIPYSKLIEEGAVRRKGTIYKGLTVYIPTDSDTLKFYPAFDEFTKNPQLYLEYPKLSDILKEIENRIVEAEAEYQKHKESPEGYKGGSVANQWEKDPLPICLKNALDKYFSDLRSGRQRLRLIWMPEDATWKQIKRHSMKKWHGRTLEPNYIRIWDVYQKNLGEKKVAALLFHELVHAATYRDKK